MSGLRENATLQRSMLDFEGGGHLDYYHIGKGPGLIVVHGALSSALTQLDLAIALSHRYTVYLPSRRGRGLSSPYPEEVTEKFKPLGPQVIFDPKSPPLYDSEFCAAVLETDICDLVALVKHTKSSFALGISAGAAILLEACVLCSASRHQNFNLIKKVIIFEPPLIFTENPTMAQEGVNLAAMAQYEEEMERGDLKAALTTTTISAKLGSRWMQASPRFIVRFLIGMAVNLEKREIKKGRGKVDQGAGVELEDKGVITMERLAPLLRYDFAAVSATTGPLSKYSRANVGRDVLLLGASDSPGYLKRGVRVLNETMDGAQMIEIPRAGHGVLSSKMWGGNVGKAVGIIESFLV